MTDWYTVDTPQHQERFIDAWGGIDAPTDEVGAMLLQVAQDDVITYALDVEDITQEALDAILADAPARYVLAQLQQAKNLWNAGRAQPDSATGSEGYSFVPRPLDKTIRALIRPKGGIPYVI